MTEPRRVVLLDLDGTLTESGPGIIKCVIKAFEAVDVPVPNDEALQRFIGSAIIDSMKLNGIPPQKLDEAVRVYRHFYGDANVFNDPNEPGRKVPGRLVNSMYEGIPEQLRKMREMGYYLAVCTAKPEYQAIPICEHFHLTDLVDGIYGASKDNSRITKEAVITYALDRIGVDRNAGDRALMVGDRWIRCGRRQAQWARLPGLRLGLCRAERIARAWRIPCGSVRQRACRCGERLLHGTPVTD